jgi:hypothetical protein
MKCDYKVNPYIAIKALELAHGDLDAAYEKYVELHFRVTGKPTLGCDAQDLYAFYEIQKANPYDGYIRNSWYIH